jgi:glutamate-1-semialdehyde 2,1-aminomutase
MISKPLNSDASLKEGYHAHLNGFPSGDIRSKLDQQVSKYVAQNPKSAAQIEVSKRALPTGTTRTILSYHPFPLVLNSGRDCYVTSADGDEYIDFISEYTAGMFGHSHPAIKDAIQEVMDSGFTLGGVNTKEGELAHALASRFPSVDAIRFANSGTEANTLAIATAITYTHKKKVHTFSSSTDMPPVC